MKLFQYTNKIDLLKLYTIGSSICLYSSIWHINTRSCSSCSKVVDVTCFEYYCNNFFVSISIRFIFYSFVEHSRLNLWVKKSVRNYERWKEYWRNTETTIFADAPVTYDIFCYHMNYVILWNLLRTQGHTVYV